MPIVDTSAARRVIPAAYPVEQAPGQSGQAGCGGVGHELAVDDSSHVAVHLRYKRHPRAFAAPSSRRAPQPHGRRIARGISDSTSHHTHDTHRGNEDEVAAVIGGVRCARGVLQCAHVGSTLVKPRQIDQR